MTKPITTKAVIRQFKFGGGETLQSQYEVSCAAVVHGQGLPVTASVVPGATPFLLARPTLEERGVMHDYKNGLMSVGNSGWFKPERNERGHFILDLMMYKTNNREEENFFLGDWIDEKQENASGSEGDHDDIWSFEPLMEADAVVLTTEENKKIDKNDMLNVDQIAEDVVRRLKEKRTLRFFEVYVDQGNLSVYLAKNYTDVEVSTFLLPEWDFDKKEVRDEFIELLREVSPEFVWLAPPCRKWSAMQRLVRRDDEQLEAWKKELKKEEDAHLTLVADAAVTSKENEND